MQSKNHHHAVVEKQSHIKTLTDLKLVPHWLQQGLRHAPFRLKISLSYALVLSIAFLGTTAGQLVGNLYTQKALERLTLEQDEARLLSEIKIAVLETKSHQQKLVILTVNSEKFDHEKNQYFAHQKKVNQLFSDLKIFVDRNLYKGDRQILDLNHFLETYDTTQTAYREQLDQLLQQIEPKGWSPEKVIAAQQLLWDFTKSQEAIKFNQLSKDLTKLVKLAYQEQEEAEVHLDNARQIRIDISIASLLLSILTATAFAVSMSRMISEPIEALTKVAEKVTKESNFSLQTPVTTEDEVGKLTKAFNILIQSVREHIEALQISNQNLEKRVEERTEELSQKNHELQSAYNQLADALQNLQQTQTQLIQAEKMSSLGQMVAGIAHEINNPLSFIYSNLEHASNYAQDLLRLIELYQKQYPNPRVAIKAEIEAIDLDFLADDFSNLIDSMKNGTDRIRQIVLSLRNFSRLDESQLKFANINEGIDSTLVIINPRVEQKIAVIKEYGDLPLVKSYPALLNQVFMNILDNAIAAIEERKVSNQYLIPADWQPTIWIHTEIIDHELVRVAIRDNGTGIHPELQDKVFDPFFTTKDVGKGTGLGLTVCHQIVEKHQGKIEVISELGAGTTFLITLPIEPS